MNISIAIADADRDYIERLSEVLQQHAELTIHVYTSGQKLQAAMESRAFDVVLFDPDVSDGKLVFPRVKFPICLYSDEAGNRGLYADFAKVAKYQRISNIYKEIIRGFADKAGYSADLGNSQRMCIVAVYSPAGGSGKTTVALAVAGQLAGLGKTALFLSVEQLSSSSYVNPRQEDGITALVEDAAGENVNFELKAKGIMKQGLDGMFYIEGFERLVDYEAVDKDEMTNTLDKFRRCGLCDVLVVDMESSLDAVGKAVLAAADRIVIVERQGELPAVKTKLFAGQGLMNEYRDRMVKICNFAESHSTYCAELDVPVAGTVHNYGNLPLRNMIQAIAANGEIAVDKILGR